MSTRIYPLEKLGDINLADYYSRANEWLNDLDFLEDELRFFKKILKLHFSNTVEATAVQIELVERQLAKLELNKHVIKAELNNYREMLDLLIKNMITQDEDFLREQHRTLELRIHLLNQSYQSFKNELFHVTEDLMGHKKAST